MNASEATGSREERHLEQTPCLLCGSSEASSQIETGTQMFSPDGRRWRFVRCRECGLVYLNPRVAPEELGRYYPPYYLPYRGPSAWGRFAPLAERGLGITDRKRVRLSLAALRKAAEESGAPAGRVVDVGCGKPTFLATLKGERAGLELTGIDFVSTGWEADPARWEGIELLEAEPGAWHPAEGFRPDLITMWHYLEHDYAPRQTLTRMAEAAADHTRLIVEVPDYNSLSRLVYGEHWQGFHTPRHTAIYSKATLFRLLRECGWEPERYRSSGSVDLYALWWMSAMERRGIDWSESLERRFPAFLAGRILTSPLLPLASLVPLGVQTVTARRKNG
ncbi:MAG: class I SAM-dependent methyltransferase [Alkalispirochaetaceae bacterium]